MLRRRQCDVKQLAEFGVHNLVDEIAPGRWDNSRNY